QHAVDGLAGEHVAAGRVDVDPEFLDVAELLEILPELLGCHLVSPPGIVGNLTVQEELADARLGRGLDLPEPTAVAAVRQCPRHPSHLLSRRTGPAARWPR